MAQGTLLRLAPPTEYWPLNLENEFAVRENSGNLGKTQKKSGKTRGICDSDPEGKGRQFGVCASCAIGPMVSKLCSLTDWL